MTATKSRNTIQSDKVKSILSGHCGDLVWGESAFSLASVRNSRSEFISGVFYICKLFLSARREWTVKSCKYNRRRHPKRKCYIIIVVMPFTKAHLIEVPLLCPITFVPKSNTNNNKSNVTTFTGHSCA